MNSNITISMCMIVKDEQAVLERCLNSYSGIFDEIIIVDTGSCDDTKKIASRYTDKIYDFEWNDDFSAARNFAFSKASCDYIFSADADEVLTPEANTAFKQLKSVLLTEIDIVQMKYVNCSHNTVYNSKKELRPKLYKRLRTFTWISPIHETVRLKPVIFDSDIEILHMPEKNHAKRDFTVFINSVNRGVHLEEYVLKMFCRELLISGTDEDLLSVSDIFINVFQNEYTKQECLDAISCVLARIYRITGKVNDFFKTALKNIAVTPCSEICMELGNYFFDAGDYAEAVIWYINASTETESILDIRTSGDLPLYGLAECYEKLSEEAEARGDAKSASVYRSNRCSYLEQAKQWKLPEELI